MMTDGEVRGQKAQKISRGRQCRLSKAVNPTANSLL